ncbi:hypothetical protein ANTRET_LOCUS992 [Anthophora retusa]
MPITACIRSRFAAVVVRHRNEETQWKKRRLFRPFLFTDTRPGEVEKFLRELRQRRVRFASVHAETKRVEDDRCQGRPGFYQSLEAVSSSGSVRLENQ